MDKRWLIGLSMLGALVIPAEGSAGYRQAISSCYTYFDGNGRSYTGSISGIYNSSNKYEELDCYVSDSASTTTVSCYIGACSGGGGMIWRNDGNARIMAALRAIASDDEVQMSWDTSGQITDVTLRKTSILHPKAH